jgi:hypothetical protein
MPTTLHDPTAPSNYPLLQPVNQCHTQSNNLFAILEDNTPDKDNNNIADNLTVYANNRTNGANLSTSLQQVRPLARRKNTPTVLINPHASLVHDLWPTTTPTLIPQPRLLQSRNQQPIANPVITKPQCFL